MPPMRNQLKLGTNKVVMNFIKKLKENLNELLEILHQIHNFELQNFKCGHIAT